ncbi:MAG: hypothetical protein K2G02_07975, partial [Phocaeicola sp.]|nr:hypothetical protein [Phocaeicola sp.]
MTTKNTFKLIAKRIVPVILFLSFQIGMTAQTTLWKHRDWEGRISAKGTLEQLIFKNNRHNDTIPFFHQESNAGPTFYANMGGDNLCA